MHLPKEYHLQNRKYRVTDIVGQGGFGITYKGIWYTEVKGSLGTIKTDVPVCIKEYFFKDYCYRDSHSREVKVHSETGKLLFDKFKEKLIKEARILSDVHHPYIVNVLEVFEENNTAYIAMEYISGASLKQLMDKEGVLPEAKVLQYVHQIGKALEFVHKKSILHLDIKPSNILIDNKGNARLIDFGVSKRYDLEQQETSTTMLTLSKGFASVEQYDNEGTVNFSPRPDIYSLGATMYNLLTGIIPTESILRATKPLQKPTELNPAITPKTEAVILKAMSIIPDDRFQTVKEMLDALDPPQDTLSETSAKIETAQAGAEDETTVLHTPIEQKLSGSGDNDETVLNIPSSTQTPSKERRRKGIMIPLLLSAFALLASAAVIWKYNRPVVDIPSGQIDEPIGGTVGNTIEDGTAIVIPETTNPEPVRTNNPITNREPVTTPERPAANQTTPEQKPEETAQQESVDRDAEYTASVTSARTKMRAGDITGARQDIDKAKSIKLNEEAILLSAEIETIERKAQYILMMPLGTNYTVVQNKSTGRYGAIDTSGKERVPCKYIGVGLSEKGRVFEREDHLYDIYNANGSLVSGDLTYY